MTRRPSTPLASTPLAWWAVGYKQWCLLFSFHSVVAVFIYGFLIRLAIVGSNLMTIGIFLLSFVKSLSSGRSIPNQKHLPGKPDGRK
jgi:hypothetical protein